MRLAQHVAREPIKATFARRAIFQRNDRIVVDTSSFLESIDALTHKSRLGCSRQIGRFRFLHRSARNTEIRLTETEAQLAKPRLIRNACDRLMQQFRSFRALSFALLDARKKIERVEVLDGFRLQPILARENLLKTRDGFIATTIGVE